MTERDQAHLRDALSYAIRKLEEQEARQGFQMPSATLSTWRGLLSAMVTANI